MKLKYIGESFGVDGLTNGQTYIATIGDMDYYRVFDNSGEDYLYPRDNPRPCTGSCSGGRWEIVEGMTEEEKELDRNFKENKDNFNALADQSAAIAERYAKLYKSEIEAYRI
ncbi:MAG: hypothetical protein PUD92_08960 [Clostridiales bacterium]|nr:hypothetical protein [Clostridiales bacterium]